MQKHDEYEKQVNMTPEKVNNHIKDLNDSEVYEISTIDLRRRMVKMINRYKKIYEHLNKIIKYK
jgi:hypothetical protein